MWFKNLQLYRMLAPVEASGEELEDKLQQKRFVPCGSQDMASLGWTSVMGGADAPMVRTVNGCHVVALKVEEKLLPSSVVKQVADERAAEIEEIEGVKLGKKRRREIRDDVLMELLPRAFTRARTVRAYIDSASGWVVVDAATPKKAEELLSHLRDTIGTLNLTLPKTNGSPATLMTEWLRAGEAPIGFTIDADCELCAPGENGAVVRAIRHDLNADEIRAHVAAGKQVVKLGMTWADRISFVLTEEMAVKKLAFLDLLQEDIEKSNAETADELFDATVALMSGELAKFMPDLMEALGGEQAQA